MVMAAPVVGAGGQSRGAASKARAHVETLARWQLEDAAAFPVFDGVDLSEERLDG